jgi:hypothetical protein
MKVDDTSYVEAAPRSFAYGFRMTGEGGTISHSLTLGVQ